MSKIKLAFKKQLCLVAFILFLGQSNIARIPTVAFKNVTIHFRPGKEYYSPIYGILAIESGLIYNLRFLGNFKAAEKNGRREYLEDTSNNDHTWNLVKALFPSPGGTLTTQIGNKHKFGNYATPQAVALLLKYAYAIRELNNQKYWSNSDKKEQIDAITNLAILELTNLLSPFKAQKQILKGENELKNLYIELLKELEKEPDIEEKELFISFNTLTEKIKVLNTDLNQLENEKNSTSLQNFEESKDQKIESKNINEEEIKKSKKENEEKLKELNKKLLKTKRIIKIRELKGLITKESTLLKKAEETKSEKEENESSDRNCRNQLKESISSIINSIQLSIAGEIQNQEEETERLYPRYTTEQIILAFFCENFNTQQEVWTLLKSMQEQIPDIFVENTNIPTDENLLIVNDIIQLTQKEQHTNLDEIYGLLNADIFTGLVPYKANTQPVSNSTTYAYDRKNKKQVPDFEFQDCAEVTMRHMFNLILFDYSIKGFNLAHLKSYITEQEDHGLIENFDNLVQFYEKQFPNSANAGDLEIRSAWNKVVGDLNDGTKQDIISYVNNQGFEYEVRAGFINLIHVWKRAFGLKIEEELESDLWGLIQTSTEEEMSNWIIQYIQTMFEICNPNNEYRIEPVRPLKKDLNSNREPDMYGDLLVQVTNKKNEGAFTFIIHIIPGHSELQNLKITNIKSSLIDQEKAYTLATTALSKLPEKENHITTLRCWKLLLPMEEQVKYSSCFLYQLYPKILQDNDSIINVLEYLTKLDIGQSKINFGCILINFIDKLGWDDPATVVAATPVIVKLQKLIFDLETSKNLQNHVNIREHVKGLAFSGVSYNIIDKELAECVGFYNKLVYLSLAKQEGIKILPFQLLKHIEVLDLSSSGIIDVSDLHECISLKKVLLSNTKQLKSISLKGLTKLSELSLNNSGVKELTLVGCNSLEKLDIASTEQLKNISLIGLDKLTLVGGLGGSGVQILRLEQCNSMASLCAVGRNNLKEIHLKGLNKLTDLSLINSNVEFIHLEQCNALVQLKTGVGTLLKSIFLIEVNNLQKIAAGLDSIETIHLEQCDSLLELDLSLKFALKEVYLDGLKNLKKLDFSSSPIQIISLQNCDSLEEIDLSGTNLDEKYIIEINKLQEKNKKLKITL